jgi:hypothetical protein
LTTRLALLLALVFQMAPAPALAGDDLADYLEQAEDAEFHGTGVLICSWGADSAAGMYQITRHDGMSMSHGPGADLMVGGGLIAMRSGDEWYAVEFADHSEWELDDRYRFGPAEATVRFGRAATEYVVLEGELPRVRLVVDDATRAPLLTEVLDGDGAVFRMAALIDFDATADPMPPMPPMEGSHTIGVAEPGDAFPGSIGAYRRANTYAVPGGAVQAFYTDGLFSFSVFETDRGATPEAFSAATTWLVGSKPYRRIVAPSQVWVHWNAPDRSYVLVGDLPPDHLEAVLGELPRPGERGVFARLWHRLFG